MGTDKPSEIKHHHGANYPPPTGRVRIGSGPLSIAPARMEPAWFKSWKVYFESISVSAALARRAPPFWECVLKEDTIRNSDVPCIQVADGVTIDPNVSTVNGSIVQLESSDDVTIKNGTVADSAVVLFGTNILQNSLTVRGYESSFTIQIGGGIITHSLFERNKVAVSVENADILCTTVIPPTFQF